MSIVIPELTIFAPAKVNLHLAVKDLRRDGFHNLESIFLSLDFGDTLHFTPVSNEKKSEISMEWEDDQAACAIPSEKNIIFKALFLYMEKTGFGRRFNVKVEKRIPSGGGLGGGSSDAAAALLALNELSGGLPNRCGLLEIAACLGSDVPFFIHRAAAAWVTGRGECIRPLDIPRIFLVLVNPGFPSGTAAAFRLLDEYRVSETFNEDQSPHIENIFNNTGSSGSWFFESLESGAFRNDFLPVFKDPEKSVYVKIISMLRETGAVFAGLSGAGSTCFGVFGEMERAQKAAAILRGNWPFVKCCASFS
ncbi:MAG: 4-(cytidine 5'-diphospho)-2-C-methyl-D-erythritol kinase [Treponema sp.]|jgi:4-diphosphocytidyl-2-C-methyl-D-erythritol kinase|nr:4-(cytidine 5'-diphospho)-2-C-methyl-D-erythritol kinase [Treponema sp.]